jgi:hypothetical protein
VPQVDNYVPARLSRLSIAAVTLSGLRRGLNLRNDDGYCLAGPRALRGTRRLLCIGKPTDARLSERTLGIYFSKAARFGMSRVQLLHLRVLVLVRRHCVGNAGSEVDESRNDNFRVGRWYNGTLIACCLRSHRQKQIGRL